jgi:hypothetical protein
MITYKQACDLRCGDRIAIDEPGLWGVVMVMDNAEPVCRGILLARGTEFRALMMLEDGTHQVFDVGDDAQPLQPHDYWAADQRGRIAPDHEFEHMRKASMLPGQMSVAAAEKHGFVPPGSLRKQLEDLYYAPEQVAVCTCPAFQLTWYGHEDGCPEKTKP